MRQKAIAIAILSAIAVAALILYLNPLKSTTDIQQSKNSSNVKEGGVVTMINRGRTFFDIFSIFDNLNPF